MPNALRRYLLGDFFPFHLLEEKETALKKETKKLEENQNEVRDMIKNTLVRVDP